MLVECPECHDRRNIAEDVVLSICVPCQVPREAIEVEDGTC